MSLPQELIMKANSVFALALVAMSATAQAAGEPPTAASTPAASKMAPHSHMQEKNGIAPPAKKTESPTSAAAKDTTKHNHQRDAK
jgi:hypothetical protein